MERPSEACSSCEINKAIAWLESRVSRRQKTISSRRHVALFKLLWRSGLRCEEACNLVIRDIVFAQGEGEVSRIVVRYGKGGKRRTVAIDQALEPVLKEWLNTLAAHGMAGLDCPVFPTRGGSIMSPGHVRQIFWNLSKSLGYRVHAHGLRATYATELHREGVSIVAIQRLLGHANLDTTQRYIQMHDTEHLIAAAARGGA